MYHKLYRVTDFKILGNYILSIRFDDDSEQVIELTPVFQVSYGDLYETCHYLIR